MKISKSKVNREFTCGLCGQKSENIFFIRTEDEWHMLDENTLCQDCVDYVESKIGTITDTTNIEGYWD